MVKLLIDAGTAACARVPSTTAMRNLPCKRLQLDEVWSFVGAKDKNIPAERAGESRHRQRGDVDRHRRRNQVGAVLAGRAAGRRTRHRICRRLGRSAQPAGCKSRPTGLKAYRGGDGSRVRRVKWTTPFCTRSTAGANDTPEARYSPRRVRGVRQEGRERLTPTRPTSRPRRTSNARTSRCGCGCRRFTRLNQRLLQEAGQPRTRRRPALLRLQLRHPAPDATDAPGVEGKGVGPHLEL